MKSIKPNLVRYTEKQIDTSDGIKVAPSLLPRLQRPEYYSSPSIEKMSQMSEADVSQIDNLEIGRYGCGNIRWPGLTDVRRLDLDNIVHIESGSLTLYADLEKPPSGEGLNKEAVVCLHVKPSRNVSSDRIEKLQAKLAQVSESFGGNFISYDLEKWIFRVPHFDGIK